MAFVINVIKRLLWTVETMYCVQTSKHKTFVQCCANVEDVGSTLYKCYTNVLCLLGIAAGLVLLNTVGDDYKPHRPNVY